MVVDRDEIICVIYKLKDSNFSDPVLLEKLFSELYPSGMVKNIIVKRTFGLEYVDTEDLYAEVLKEVFKALSKLDKPEYFIMYVATITHKIIDKLYEKIYKGEKERVKLIPLDFKKKKHNVQQTPNQEDYDCHELLNEAIRKIRKRKHKEIAWLKYHLELTSSEIAERLGGNYSSKKVAQILAKHIKPVLAKHFENKQHKQKISNVFKFLRGSNDEVQ